MKRVLIFSLNYHPFVGGAEIALRQITDRIPPEEIEFHMVTLRMDSALPKVEKIGNVLVHRIGLARKSPSMSDLKRFPLHLNKYWYQFAAARYAESLHNTYRYEGIWAMMAHSAGIPAGRFKTLHPEVKYLLTLQEGDPTERIESMMRPVRRSFRRGFESADALQAISSFLLAWGKRMGFAGDGIVIPNGVDLSRFRYLPRDIDGERGVRLITTSRLVHKNGIDTVVRALPLLPDATRFIVYGSGPNEAKLKALAEELGVSGRVEFRGEVAYDRVPEALQEGDIFVRPSRSEGMGNSFIEAMAAGLPVIATQEGGIADFLFDSVRDAGKGATGWAVDQGAPEQVAQAVGRITNAPEEAIETVERARHLVVSSYGWDKVASDMRALLTGIL